MSDEKKIRDLMNRLVAMTPEPPPYPEETQAVPRPVRKGPRPVLAFATAAALVALLAIPLLLFTGEPPPVGVGSTTTTTVAETSTSLEPATTMTVPVVQPVTGVVFFYQQPENSSKGDPALVPVELHLEVRAGQDIDFYQAWQWMIMGRVGLPGDLQSAVPPEVLVESTRTEGQTIVADMNEAFRDGAGLLLADMTMLNQLIYTLTYGHPDFEVLFTVDGEPVTAFGTDGIDLSEPVDRLSFQEDLAFIYLTEPLLEADGTYTVTGLANTFEAALTLRVLDSSGEMIHEEPVQASEGGGVWGEFSVHVDAALITPGESSIQLLVYSAKDGEPTEITTVPIDEGRIYLVGG